MYGFPVTTYDGKWPQVVGWDSSWASFFSKMLIGALQLDVVTNGPWKELEDIVDQTVKDVIPLLLGFLETGGRSIKPCLIHGDLWEGNIGTDSETGRLYVYDAACYYAHNEMELGMWRINHHNLIVGKYRKEYRKNMEASKPKTQWDDRNRLYSCKAKLLLSASVPKSRFRSQVYEDLSWLVRAYSGEAGEVRAREAFGEDGAADALAAVGWVQVPEQT
ncbi:hypothetical protein G7Y79_00024g056660 [Physcia stellaris]|nr:hypothetical protein G7Y79_00024g056660 [Physcia stellaris]